VGTQFAARPGEVSLEKFIGSRLVVPSLSARIYDAVRAIDNRIGALLIPDGTAFAGIVADGNSQPNGAHDARREKKEESWLNHPLDSRS
jgi:hypothetical protein